MSPADQSYAAMLIGRAVSRIEDAMREFKPVTSFALFSGGHDSLTASHCANCVKGLTGTCHINTGIGVEQTRQFVRQTAIGRKWRLLEYKAMENCRADGTPDPQDYRAFVRKHGFPGPAGHGMMYVRLKDRQIARLVRDHKVISSKDRIMLIAGCRSQESERRMRNTKPVQRDGARVWVNPIHDFTKSDCHKVMEYAGLKRSPVVDLIHKSGECLCGAFAKPGELAELKLWFPDTAREIEELEAEVKPKFGWGWEGRPPTAAQRKRITKGQTEMPLCNNCLIGDQP